MKSKKLLVINGSIEGSQGNCGRLVKAIKKKCSPVFQLSVSHLKEDESLQVEKKLALADCLMFVTGTYWESWGSPLQKFFEDFTHLEGTELFVGKPVGCVVLCHSTGGKSVLSRMQGNLNLFGCTIPPFCGMELSLIAQISATLGTKNQHHKDLWQVDDLNIVLHNLRTSCEHRSDFQAWPIDDKNFRKKWLKI